MTQRLVIVELFGVIFENGYFFRVKFRKHWITEFLFGVYAWCNHFSGEEEEKEQEESVLSNWKPTKF